MKVGIIGATGWLGAAFGQRLLSEGVIAPADLVVLNRSGARADYFGHHDVIWASDVADLVERTDIVVVSVRPADWPGLSLKADNKLVMSFMAGVTLEDLSATGARIVRVVPNAAAEIGRSYSPWVAEPGTSDTDRITVTRLLSAIGTSDELPSEDQIDLMIAVPGAGPAYPAMMAAAMIEYLRAEGVAEPIAARAVEATICTAPQLLVGKVNTAEGLVKTYIDYDGTTAAGLRRAQAENFSAAVKAGLSESVGAAMNMNKK